MRWVFFLAMAGCLMVGTSSFAAAIPQTDSAESSREASEVVVQIFGRMCEYRREDVEGALRAFNTVKQVEFLNDQARCWFDISPAARRPSCLPAPYTGHLRQGGIVRHRWIVANRGR
jgi:hypothetical protein